MLYSPRIMDTYLDTCSRFAAALPQGQPDAHPEYRDQVSSGLTAASGPCRLASNGRQTQIFSSRHSEKTRVCPTALEARR